MHFSMSSYSIDFFLFTRRLFFGENEIAVRVPSLFKLLIKEVRSLSYIKSGTAFIILTSLMHIFYEFLSVPSPGLKSFLHLPALQCYTVECWGLLLLCYSHSFHVCDFNSYLSVHHSKGKSWKTLGGIPLIFLFHNLKSRRRRLMVHSHANQMVPFLG